MTLTVHLAVCLCKNSQFIRFGEREVIETQEGITYGAHEARDGVNLSMQCKTRPVVSPTQILELPVNTAFVKLAEERAVTQVKLSINN